jgi:hypothetical protein
MPDVEIKQFFAATAIDDQINRWYFSGEFRKAMTKAVAIFPELRSLTLADLVVLEAGAVAAAEKTDPLDGKLATIQVIAALTGKPDPLD